MFNLYFLFAFINNIEYVFKNYVTENIILYKKNYICIKNFN